MTAQRASRLEGECRYDYIVIAIESLKQYMDTCVLEGNTASLIRDAHDAIHEIEKIEKGMKSDFRPDNPKKPVTSALAEFESKLMAVKPVMGKVERFIKDSKAAFDMVSEVQQTIKQLDGHYEVLKSINRKLDSRIARAAKGC